MKRGATVVVTAFCPWFASVGIVWAVEPDAVRVDIEGGTFWFHPDELALA